MNNTTYAYETRVTFGLHAYGSASNNGSRALTQKSLKQIRAPREDDASLSEALS